jgi:hypothetical protein
VGVPRELCASILDRINGLHPSTATRFDYFYWGTYHFFKAKTPNGGYMGNVYATRLAPVFGLLILAILICMPNPAEAHHAGDHAVTIHTNNTWGQCAIVLDASLTQSEFGDFVKELAPMLYFRPMSGAKPLGKSRYEISYELWKTAPIQDYEGKWNNTFSHPNADHWLTADDHTLSFPVPRARMGITDDIDAEIFYAPSGANYSFFGLAMKYAIPNDPETGWAFSLRPSYSTLRGVADMSYDSLAVDALASKDMGFFRPYVGGTFLYGWAAETTSKVALNNETVPKMELIVGSEFNWKYLSMALEADIGIINMYSVKLGVSF